MGLKGPVNQESRFFDVHVTHNKFPSMERKKLEKMKEVDQRKEEI